jgi:DNA polymerase (family X)
MAVMMALPSRKIEIALAAARRTLQTAGSAAADADAAVAELTRVPGLGPARARQLYEELGLGTLDELDEAVAGHRVSTLRGFSPAFEERLRDELATLLHPSSRMPLPEADVHVTRLLQYMRHAPGLEHVEVAGSYRRRCPTLGDIDLLAVSSRPAGVVRYFTTYADAASANSIDASRGSLTLNCGLRVELRVVPRRCYGATLHYLTGSIAYNAAVRALGLERGVRVSEYGVFGLAEGKAGARRLGGQREEDVFEALAIQWVPPELREGTGEIEAAAAGELPTLVSTADIRGDILLRTRWSSGEDTAEQMVRACREQGHAWCGVADSMHTPGAPGLSPRTLREQAKEIAALRTRIGGIHVIHAVEATIRSDGSVNIAPAEREVADLVIGSLQAASRRGRTRSPDCIVAALEGGLIDVLAAYPALADGLSDAAADAVIRTAAERGVPILFSGADGFEQSAGRARRARALGARVLLGTGAGTSADLQRMRFLVDQARRGWLGPADVLNTLDWPNLLSWLRGRRAAVAG